MKKVRATAVLTGKAAEIWEKLPKKIRGLILAQLLEEAYFLGKLDVFFGLNKSEEQTFLNQLQVEKFRENGVRISGLQEEEQVEKEQVKREIKEILAETEEEKEEEKKKEFDFLEELEKRFQVM